MNTPRMPPLPGKDLNAWARQVYEYLASQSPIGGSVQPQALLLAHQKDNQIERAAAEGLVMYDPTNGYLVFSKAGAWVGLQELLQSGVNIKTINGVSILGGGDLPIAGGGGANVGTATLDFGNYGTDTTVAVTGQTGIVTGSKVFVSISAVDTADNLIDEIFMDPPQVFGGNIVAGTGFTIYGRCVDGGLHGRIDVNWSWT